MKRFVRCIECSVGIPIALDCKAKFNASKIFRFGSWSLKELDIEEVVNGNRKSLKRLSKFDSGLGGQLKEESDML